MYSNDLEGAKYLLFDRLTNEEQRRSISYDRVACWRQIEYTEKQGVITFIKRCAIENFSTHGGITNVSDWSEYFPGEKCDGVHWIGLCSFYTLRSVTTVAKC